MSSPVVPQAVDASLRSRAAVALPGGMYGHMSVAALGGAYPQFIAGADGCRLTDVDGREYVDLMIVSVTASLRTFDRRLEQAAANLGAGPWATFRQVTLPLLLPGIASGAVFAFVTSFDEVVVSLFIQSPSLQTLPVKMFTSVTNEVDPTIGAASSLIVVFTTLLVLIPQLVRRSHAN